ncbi:hypothetical protein FZ934_24400 (plasmid) [Rhizobium grahamii]|uniref:Transmembrane protein n=1 Tax=Rhizobium grahamii TaxID=1120045 RepID=A0A5Q0CGP2_9HYPH|nr:MULTISPECIES: hypothetical protein [Rhizobium]QFY63410.1 hypothetical protein FZ934_24400 [Rhizobium grahamii]QRM51825.1 hypothetical protein F3Y33_21245 [Rhizobium sp. BG6]
MMKAKLASELSGSASHREDRLEFLASHGGPFFEIQRRLNIVHERNLHTSRRILMFVAAAWVVPLLLTLPTLAWQTPTLRAYLTDPGPWARFFIGIAAFLAAEQAVESGLRRKLGQFLRAPLIPPSLHGSVIVAVDKSLKRRDSFVAEAACLALAIVSVLLAFATFRQAPSTSWAVTVTGDVPHLTLAGWWSVFISIPLFIFLFARGVWRHLVWAQLLRNIARLDLRLVSTHPDGKGGLAFVGEYPNAYVLFVFGVSCGMAAAVAKHQMQGDLSVATLTTIMAAWLLLVLAFFAYPLSAFSKPLAQMKDRTLLTLSARATTLQRASERKAIGENVVAPDVAEAEQSIDPVDLSKQYEQTRKLSSMLVNRRTLLPVAAAALIPFAIAGASQLPYKEVFSVLKKLLLV